jgi:predicted cation transporter
MHHLAIMEMTELKIFIFIFYFLFILEQSIFKGSDGGMGKEYGPTFQTGDTIGLGNLKKHIFYFYFCFYFIFIKVLILQTISFFSLKTHNFWELHSKKYLKYLQKIFIL